MSQTLHDRAELHRFNVRNMTIAGWFWCTYVLVAILAIYAFVDLVTRWFA